MPLFRKTLHPLYRHRIITMICRKFVVLPALFIVLGFYSNTSNAALLAYMKALRESTDFALCGTIPDEMSSPK